MAASFKARLERLKAHAAADDATAREAVRKALGDANSYVVGVAAEIAARRAFDDLERDLLAAYERLFDPTPDDPDLSLDPLAGGKRAIAAALSDIGYREPEPFLRGLDHIQREPVYGGKQDMAAELRCACAYTLVGCFIAPGALLERLVDHLVDSEAIVRVATVRAISALGAEAGLLLLRLKALAGDAEDEVVRECLRALVNADPAAIPFVARFLRSHSDAIRIEAAGALAESRDSGALAVVRTHWPNEVSANVRRGIAIACGASPRPEAADFLLMLVGEGQREIAIAALEALAASRFARDARDRTRDAVTATGDAAIQRSFEAAFH